MESRVSNIYHNGKTIIYGDYSGLMLERVAHEGLSVGAPQGSSN